MSRTRRSKTWHFIMNCRGMTSARRMWWRAERLKIKTQLRKGDDEPKTRTRSSVKWDWW